MKDLEGARTTIFEADKQKMVDTILKKLGQTHGPTEFLSVFQDSVNYLDLFADFNLTNLNMTFLFSVGIKAKANGVSYEEFSQWLISLVSKEERRYLGEISPTNFLNFLKEIWVDHPNPETD